MLTKQDKFLQYDIFEYDELNSTMSKIKEFGENTIVIAQKQTAGRGKENRKWCSEDNGNLYFSMSLKTDKEYDYSQLSFVVSIAMREVIPNSISKWPNDIIMDEKKCCGILLEFDTNLIIGCGLNIKTYPDNVNFEATSLENENIFMDKYQILKSFLQNFNYYYGEWQRQGFSFIREIFLKKCYKFKQIIKINNDEGIFYDIDKDGTLILKTHNDTKKIRSGDIWKN
ncbi:MAG: biotin--[acetyl-CoA-carboxylase] ligase [Rickettsiales bacterium]|jgi:BirA family biotin operon repressor/biotin-[acetyl-CoA-carboxylase] ligase|nr:biotin--[acetyl-CoA-carboxylase] ligase [Rickettsiales bacterium]